MYYAYNSTKYVGDIKSTIMRKAKTAFYNGSDKDGMKHCFLIDLVASKSQQQLDSQSVRGSCLVDYSLIH